MEIFPQNLSRRYYVELVRRRSAKGMGEPRVDEPLPKPELKMMGKLWTKGLNLTAEQAALAVPASSLGTKSVAAITTLVGTLFVGIGSVALGASSRDALLGFSAFGAGMTAVWSVGSTLGGQYILRRAHQALGLKESEELIERCQDDLEKSYLQLVRDAIRVEGSEKSAEKLREALEALGQAIEALPPITIEPQDTSLMHAQATLLREKATTETDSVIAQSLLRQAESVEQRTQSQEKAALLARRTTVLRDEIFAKIAALRDALAAQQSGQLDATALATLSQSARDVARESQSAAAAQEELAHYLTVEATPAVQTLRH